MKCPYCRTNYKLGKPWNDHSLVCEPKLAYKRRDGLLPPVVTVSGEEIEGVEEEIEGEFEDLPELDPDDEKPPALTSKLKSKTKRSSKK